MKFSTRNAFYLRASNYRVVPLFLYLDERHVDWMEDRVLQMVIAELQPKMRDLLFDGRFQKKHKVYVERGEGYQYCYFLRSTTRTEVVLLKQKTFGLRPPTPPRKLEPPPSPRKSTPRGRRDRSSAVSSESGGSPPLAMVTSESEEDVKPIIVEEEEEERNIKDWKPDVSLTYKGFGTSSVQLVLIIEPYPPLPSSEYAPPSSRLSTRSASVMSSRSRSRTGTRATYARNSSMSLSLAPSGSVPAQPQMRNMRNATRSISATPGPSYGRGSSSTPAGTPSPGGTGEGGARGRTPLFMPRDTPFGEDEDDEEEHLAYTAALREGRMRLPSVSRPAGPELAELGKKRKGSRRSARYQQDDDDDDDDIPEGIMEIGQRLVRSSEIEEGVVRVQGGWEERGEGEESAVMGREEPGD